MNLDVALNVLVCASASLQRATDAINLWRAINKRQIEEIRIKIWNEKNKKITKIKNAQKKISVKIDIICKNLNKLIKLNNCNLTASR